jgi:hypothetical protein
MRAVTKVIQSAGFFIVLRAISTLHYPSFGHSQHGKIDAEKID